ncbi:MAG: trypsin-like peptidase domain-containing protein [Oscillospiraceae bacterium]|nr:trypsin-like peptidase domain-containing protein [Oscillospiraceae bacterium]
MENHENEELHPENEYTEPQAPEAPHQPEEQVQPYGQPYSGAGVGRKESPFADSPYVMNHDNGAGGYQYQPQSGYVPPVPPQEPVRKPPKKKKKGSGRVWKTILASVLTVVLVAGGCGITAWMVNDHWSAKTQRMTESFNEQIADLQEQIDANSNAAMGNSVSGSPVSTDGGLTPSQVYAQNVGSVVAISNQSTTNYFGQISETASSGSGFILTEDGYVVTNYHVVEGATKLTVLTYDSAEYEAQLIGYDENNDIAILKIEAEGLQAATIGSSDDLIVGDQVVAIGNPLGELTSTLTVGYISAKERIVTSDNTQINMMQTDAAINPGNSGGPLFNMKGEVIGITTAKYSGSTSSGASIEGIGFAIPIDDVIGMIESYRDFGYDNGAYLGVMVRTVDSETSSMYGLPLGSYVESVTAGSCAETAGIQPKDIIIGIGDYTVESNVDLTRSLRKFSAGDTTTIKVYRGGQEVTLTITLDEKPHEDTTVQEPAESSEMPENGTYDEWYKYFFGNGNNGG